MIGHLIMCSASTDPGSFSSDRRFQGADGLGPGLLEAGRPTYIASRGIRWDSLCMRAYNTMQYIIRQSVKQILNRCTNKKVGVISTAVL